MATEKYLWVASEKVRVGALDGPRRAGAWHHEAQRTPQLAGFGTQLVEWSKAKGEGGSERERERARRRERERRGTVEWWGVALRTFSVASVASMLLVVVS